MTARGQFMGLGARDNFVRKQMTAEWTQARERQAKVCKPLIFINKTKTADT